MDRAEGTGLGVAIIGHAVLFGLLSVGFLATPNPKKLTNTPLDVFITDEVGLVSQAPQVSEDPAQSKAPELGDPEDAPAAAEAEAEPEPSPVKPAPAPAPQPEPKPVAKPAQKPAPAPKPAPQPKPQPAKPAAASKAEPKKNTPPRAAPTTKKADAPKAAQGSGSGKVTRPRGGLLGAEFEKGLRDGTKGKSAAPKAQVGARAMSSIAALIREQVKPCYDLGSLGGTPAMEITTVLSLKFRPDGAVQSVAVAEQAGVTGANQRYAKQMAELSRRAVLRCSPLKGLPKEYYEGGWEDFDMGFIPRQLG